MPDSFCTNIMKIVFSRSGGIVAARIHTHSCLKLIAIPDSIQPLSGSASSSPKILTSFGEQLASIEISPVVSETDSAETYDKTSSIPETLATGAVCLRMSSATIPRVVIYNFPNVKSWFLIKLIPQPFLRQGRVACHSLSSNDHASIDLATKSRDLMTCKPQERPRCQIRSPENHDRCHWRDSVCPYSWRRHSREESYFDCALLNASSRPDPSHIFGRVAT